LFIGEYMHSRVGAARLLYFQIRRPFLLNELIERP
jgi:hypothetical protein